MAYLRTSSLFYFSPVSIRGPRFDFIRKYPLNNIVLMDDLEGQIWLESKKDIVEYTSLNFLEYIGSRSCLAKVQLKTAIDHTPFQVFQGLNFCLFLTEFDGKDGFKESARTWHRTNNFLATLPPHPNIMPPPPTLVVINDGNSTLPIVCGSLSTFFLKGNLDERLEAAYKPETKIPLNIKKSWCVQMVAAVKHAHYVGRTYHIDIKPSNVLINDEDALVLIDWEQTCGTPLTTAPEADGRWEVHEEQHSCGTTLKYTKYQGPERNNTSFDGWFSFNVFPLWNVTYPKAVEKAEVFSLGRMMWIILRQPNMDWEEVDHPNDLVCDWDEADDTIPVAWRNLVDRCLSLDPNSRPDMDELDSLIALWNC
jgi:serine/threonine protein kinase